MRYVDSFFRISIIPPFYFTISKHCLPSSFSCCIVLSYFIKHNWSPPNYTDICFYQVVASAFGSVVVSRAVTSIQLRSPSFFSTMAHLLTNRSRIRHHSPDPGRHSYPCDVPKLSVEEGSGIYLRSVSRRLDRRYARIRQLFPCDRCVDWEDDTWNCVVVWYLCGEFFCLGLTVHLFNDQRSSSTA